jgi:hypothetical protein
MKSSNFLDMITDRVYKLFASILMLAKSSSVLRFGWQKFANNPTVSSSQRHIVEHVSHPLTSCTPGRHMGRVNACPRQGQDAGRTLSVTSEYFLYVCYISEFHQISRPKLGTPICIVARGRKWLKSCHCFRLAIADTLQVGQFN